MHDAHQVVLNAWRYWASWADAHRASSGWFAMILGLVLTLPWVLPAVQDVIAVQASLAQRVKEENDLIVLQERNTELSRLISAEATLPDMPDGVAQFTMSAHAQGLQTSSLSVGKPTTVVMAERSSLQQLPLRVRVQGAWADWQHWIAHWPDALPGVTLTGLELQTQPSGDVLAEMSVWVPQRAASQLQEPMGAELNTQEQTSRGLALDAAAWAKVQQASRQHASFAPWRTSELTRPRQPLESVALEQVHYAGHLEQAGRKLALLRVNPSQQTALAEFHTVEVGAYVGHDMGRIEAIEPQQLRLRELVRDANGAWRVRSVLIPFKEGWP